MKKAVVTGANGFVGTHLVKELANAGYEVTAILKEGTPDEQIRPYVANICLCDLSDLASLPARITHGYDSFYHLAWVGSAGAGRADFALQLKNVEYTCDAVAAAAQLGCARFIGAGSIMEDESNQFIPTDGAKPGGPYMYSIAKLTAHYMAKTLANQLGIDFCWGKISNAYGPGDTTGRFVCFLVRNLLEGKDCDLTAGTQTYDFLYVSEVARAFRYIGEAGVSFHHYYIGSLSPRPLWEYVTLARDAINPSVQLRFGAVPFNGFSLGAECFDATPLQRDTGFQNKVPFEEGIVQYAEWLRQQEKL